MNLEYSPHDTSAGFSPGNPQTAYASPQASQASRLPTPPIQLDGNDRDVSRRSGFVPEVLKLEGSWNFSEWQYTTRTLLENERVISLVDGSDDIPEAHRGHESLWQAKNQYAMALLRYRMDSRPLALTNRLETAKEIWDLIEREYAPRSDWLLESLRRLDQISLASSSNVDDYAHKFQRAAKDLQQSLEPFDISQLYIYVLFMVRLGSSYDRWASEFMQEASLTQADCASRINFDTMINSAEKEEVKQKSWGGSVAEARTGLPDHHQGTHVYRGTRRGCGYCRRKNFPYSHPEKECFRLNPGFRKFHPRNHYLRYRR